jgi:hypothetical protein
MTEGRYPWHRQKGEGWKAYEAFTTYLTLGPDRTQAETARILGKSPQMMKIWAKQWHWTMRAAAYEEHYMLLRLESVEAERDDMYKRHRALANLGLSIVEGHFSAMVDELHEALGKEEKLPEQFRPDALVRLFDTAAKLDRMATQGRLEADSAKEAREEKLADVYSDELADVLGGIIEDLGLSPQQQKEARKVITKHLTGGAAA